MSKPALTCAIRGGVARGPIRVDGSDECPCDACQNAMRIETATGAADAAAETLNMALGYLTVHDDPKEGRRLIRLARYSLGEISHALRQVRGDRSWDEPFEMDPDWVEQDEYQEPCDRPSPAPKDGGADV